MKNFIFDVPAAYARSLAKTMPFLLGYRLLRGFIEFYLVTLPLRGIPPRSTASAGILPYLGKRDLRILLCFDTAM
ncbi:hypothetical protein [uncultured Campylobacter sp.]|uniref:hypothetical protein n=1 Tax=uncultured Campylobacter sp. TaxID=218934 RepID=UPI002612B98A|nr:hypothetical protein [uncultured Campylobacter sp.]